MLALLRGKLQRGAGGEIPSLNMQLEKWLPEVSDIFYSLEWIICDFLI